MAVSDQADRPMKLERAARPAAPGASLLQGLLGRSHLYNYFFGARTPETEPVVLGQRRVFILPTLHGITFGLALVLMLIGSVNYQLALGFMLTFLLAGMSLVGIVHAFRNIVLIEIRAGRSEAVFAGEDARFTIHVENRARYERPSIHLKRADAHAVVDCPAGTTSAAVLRLAAQRRGWLVLGRVTVETRYPLGLVRAWGYAQLNLRVLVYPRPDGAPLPPEAEMPDQGDAVAVGFGADDFVGLRQYQPSDSPRHIAWKAMSRDDSQLLTKQFSGRGSVELWLDWNLMPAELDVEARLSRLAGWVLAAEESQRFYGLRIPGIEIAPERGLAHRDACLKALALYGDSDEQR